MFRLKLNKMLWRLCNILKEHVGRSQKIFSFAGEGGAAASMIVLIHAYVQRDKVERWRRTDWGKLGSDFAKVNAPMISVMNMSKLKVRAHTARRLKKRKKD